MNAECCKRGAKHITWRGINTTTGPEGNGWCIATGYYKSPYCDEIIYSHVEFCPWCGAKLHGEPPPPPGLPEGARFAGWQMGKFFLWRCRRCGAAPSAPWESNANGTHTAVASCCGKTHWAMLGKQK